MKGAPRLFWRDWGKIMRYPFGNGGANTRAAAGGGVQFMSSTTVSFVTKFSTLYKHKHLKHWL